MAVFFCILFLATTIGLLLHIHRTRRLLRELKDALHAQRRFLPEASKATLKLHGVAGLIREANDFIDRHKLYAEQSTGYSKQIEAMLRAVQEVVVVFNSDRVIEFANKSAEKLFRNGLSISGLRIDSVFRSLSLLELLEASVEEGGGSEGRQISIEHEGETFWFEASCAKVRGITEPRGLSTLLVLHDITRLKRLEVMRREFIANVSHELRTPLTIIKGFAESLVDDEATMPPESRTRFLGKILNNAERLHVLVEDLLALSRLESQQGELDSEMQPLRPLLEEIVEDYRSRLKPQGQAITLDFDDRIGVFAFDRFRVNQVLDNLVVNVFRYAPDFGLLTLRVRLNEEAGKVECAVVDDGPGIPESDLPHIFERFYRVDKGRSKERGGTGLGLSIVKHIVQLHGGTIHAESRLGEGTTIHFSLPFPGRVSETGSVI
jgi:signal transduction histidine kinase